MGQFTLKCLLSNTVLRLLKCYAVMCSIEPFIVNYIGTKMSLLLLLVCISFLGHFPISMLLYNY